MLSTLNELIYYVMCYFTSTFVDVDGTAQFTYFLVTKLNITIITSCDSLLASLSNTCTLMFTYQFSSFYAA